MLGQYARAKFYTLTKLQGSIYTSRNYLKLLNLDATISWYSIYNSRNYLRLLNSKEVLSMMKSTTVEII